MDPKTKQLVEEAEAKVANAPRHNSKTWLKFVADVVVGYQQVGDSLGQVIECVGVDEDEAEFLEHAPSHIETLCSAVREQDKRARYAEAERDAFGKRIEELEANKSALRAKLQELTKDWDWVAGDTELFSPGYREAVTVCSKSIKELSDSTSPGQTLKSQ